MGFFDGIGMQGAFSPQAMAPAIAQARGPAPQAQGGGDGFWDSFGQFLQGDEQTGESPLTGLARFGDQLSELGKLENVFQPRQSVPQAAPIDNAGLQGLFQQVNAANQGGWGRGF